MPANPYKEQRRCFAYLLSLFSEMDKSAKINRKLLVCKVLSEYAVSEQCVEKFIQNYIDTGALRDDHGVLCV